MYCVDLTCSVFNTKTEKLNCLFTSLVVVHPLSINLGFIVSLDFVNSFVADKYFMCGQKMIKIWNFKKNNFGDPQS